MIPFMRPPPLLNPGSNPGAVGGGQQSRAVPSQACGHDPCPCSCRPPFLLIRAYPFLILAGRHRSYPFRMSEVPLDRLAHAAGKPLRPPPAQFTADPGGVDGIAPVVARTVFD